MRVSAHAVRRRAIQAFFEKVTRREDTDAPTPIWAKVRLTLKDGRRLSRRVKTLRGSTRKPLSEPELTAKLQDCLAWGPGRPFTPMPAQR